MLSDVKGALMCTLGTLILVMFIYLTGYAKGKDSAEKEWINKLNVAQLENAQRMIEQERELSDKQNKIVSDLMAEMEKQKNEYEVTIQTLNANSLRDSFTLVECMSDKDKLSSKLSTKTTNKSSVRCYTESDLLGKVKESLAVGTECDLLAQKYNSLLEVCKQ